MDGQPDKGPEDVSEAFTATDRRLRRISKLLKEGADPGSDDFKAELKRSRRQVQRNRQLLGRAQKG